MKKILLFIFFICYGKLSAQFFTYYPPDTARQIIANAKNPEDIFYGYYGLDRYYYRSGLYDSSEIAQKEMYAIAKRLNRDSLLCDVNMSISNKYLSKQDYNFALIYALRGLDFVNSNFRQSRVNVNIAGVYDWSGNFETALQYLRKYDALGGYPHFILFTNMYYGMAYNGLGKPDSAIYYLQKTEEGNKFRPDIFGYAFALAEFGRAYELKGDSDLADVYFRKALTICKNQNAWPIYVFICNNYCKYLISQGSYSKALGLASENLSFAKQGGNVNGAGIASEVLQKIYSHFGNRDSAYYYAMMQINFKDSASNQKKITEFQNITFAQKLREIDEESKQKLEESKRKQNIQLALIALGIIIFIILFLLLSRSFITNTKMIEFFGVIALLIVFEFLNLLLHPILERITSHSQVLILISLVCIAALLVPLHHKAEKWATKKLVVKNKAIRLAAAKRTIEKLESDQTN